MGLTILLADNSMATQNLGRKILTEAGYDVVTVSNGIAAGKKIVELRPDLALLDVYMPGYTGLEICEKTKAAPETARMPVLLTVGRIEPFCPEEGIKVKADGVITKPFEAGDLLAVVGRLTGSVPQSEPALPPAGVAPKNGDSAHTPAPGATADAPVPKQAIQILQPPPEPTPPKLAVSAAADSSIAKRAIQTVPAAPKPTPPKPSVVAAVPAPQPVRKPPKAAFSSDAAATAQSPGPRFSTQGGEICDVCGCVNAEHAVVCQQCDVPLPSSLSLHKPRASHPLL